MGRSWEAKRAITYLENEAAYHTGTFNNSTYFDKIDAIKNGDIDEFEELCDNYESFIAKTRKELGDSVDATYGLKGNAAEWGDMSGGAGQIVTPFGGNVLKKLGHL